MSLCLKNFCLSVPKVYVFLSKNLCLYVQKTYVFMSNSFMSFCPKTYVFMSEEELWALSKVECLVSKVAWSSFCLLINFAHVGAEHTDSNEQCATNKPYTYGK